MSKLEELIKQLCPNGVEYNKLKEVCTDFIVPMRDRPKVFDGNIPWCRIEDMEGHEFNKSLSGLCVSEETIKDMNLKVYPTGTVICSCSASIGAYAINTQPLITNQTFIGLVCGKNLFNKYLLYYMETQTKNLLQMATTGTIPYISRKKFENLVIPVPPMEVQCEIVRILDNFTEFTAELTTELAAELTARRKQYEYYRDELLTFDETVEWKNLLTVSDTFTGLTYRPTDKTNDGTGTLVLRSSNIQNGKLVFDDSVRVSMKKIPERAMIKARDVLICVRNGSKALVGKSVRIPELSEPMAFGAFMSILRPKIDMIDADYLFYAWQFVYEQIRRNNDDSMVINQITQKDFASIKIPIPSLEEQERIVSILDRFDKLCNDISVGLPAEIEARKKQYEYYRDKLLTFEPIQSTEKELA